MSAEFDHLIIAIEKIGLEITDPRIYTIAERRAASVLLDDLHQKNRKLIQLADKGRSRS